MPWLQRQHSPLKFWSTSVWRNIPPSYSSSPHKSNSVNNLTSSCMFHCSLHLHLNLKLYIGTIFLDLVILVTLVWDYKLWWCPRNLPCIVPSSFLDPNTFLIISFSSFISLPSYRDNEIFKSVTRGNKLLIFCNEELRDLYRSRVRWLQS